MRFLPLKAAGGVLVLVNTVKGADVCDHTTVTTNWYLDMIYAAYQGSSSAITGTLSGWTPGPTKDTAWATVAGGAASDCQTCIFNFIDAVNAKVGHSMTSCGSNTVYTTNVNMVDSDCLLELYQEINDFNDCASNGIDVVTAVASTRCTYEEFVGIEGDFLPYQPMVKAARSGVLLASYESYVGAGFAARLNSVPCGICFDQLYTNMGTPNADCAVPTSPACVSDLATPLETFAECTGGLALNTVVVQQCDTAEKVLFDDIYRPYKAYVTCSAYDNWTSDYAEFQTCADQYSGIEETPSSPCDNCYNSFVEAANDEKVVACNSSVFSDACIASLSGLRGALGEFRICTGFDMSTVNTLCTSSEWSALDPVYKNYADLYIIGSGASDQFAAGNEIDDDADVIDLKNAVDSLGCSSCFKAFIGDAFYQSNNSATIRDKCTNPYSDDCYQVLVPIIDRFSQCSGYDLINTFEGRCTLTEVALVSTSGDITNLLGLGLDAATEAAIESGFSGALVNSGSHITAECEFCYLNLAKDLFAQLADGDKAKCASDWSSSDCETATASILSAFQSCSGQTLQGDVTTTTTTTTTEPTTTTTPAPTTIATTTKNANAKITTASAALLLAVALAITN